MLHTISILLLGSGLFLHKLGSYCPLEVFALAKDCIGCLKRPSCTIPLYLDSCWNDRALLILRFDSIAERYIKPILISFLPLTGPCIIRQQVRFSLE